MLFASKAIIYLNEEGGRAIVDTENNRNNVTKIIIHEQTLHRNFGCIHNNYYASVRMRKRGIWLVC